MVCCRSLARLTVFLQGLPENLFERLTASAAEPHLQGLKELFINFWGAFNNQNCHLANAFSKSATEAQTFSLHEPSMFFSMYSPPRSEAAVKSARERLEEDLRFISKIVSSASHLYFQILIIHLSFQMFVSHSMSSPISDIMSLLIIRPSALSNHMLKLDHPHLLRIAVGGEQILLVAQKQELTSLWREITLPSYLPLWYNIIWTSIKRQTPILP